MKACFTIFIAAVAAFLFPIIASAELGQAAIHGTLEGSTVEGTALFEETSQGLNVSVQITGAPPGKHGFHIHQFGSCGDRGKAAGGHYNPGNTTHGFLPDRGLLSAHAGDLGNIEIAEDGAGSLELQVFGLSLSGGYGVAGRTVILHEKADDFGQPTGNAGARIGCGTILITQ